MSNRFVLITGCSGGGKSTLLSALSARGYSTVAEPGRRIIAEERDSTGEALPWVNMTAFALRAVQMARADLLAASSSSELVFFDRGLVDAAVALDHYSGTPYRKTLGNKLQYSKIVFLAPPWPEIFSKDHDRVHDLDAAKEEFDRLETALHNLSYEVHLLPLVPVAQRVEFVLSTLSKQ